MEKLPKLLTRFAPSPTGYLHLGHIASAIYVWGIGARLDASVLLRIEDHDQGRSRREFEKAIFEDLSWLGFEGVNQDLRHGQKSLFRQSDSHEVYEAALAELKARQRVYACICSRKDILSQGQPDKISLPQDPGSPQEDLLSELRYPGTCRDRNIPIGREGVALRLALPDQDIPFTDLRMGLQLQNPFRQCGDLLLRDRHGYWTYQFAVTVDDMRHGITHVIRGMDLLPSTGRQMLLASWLGRKTPPTFYHHPLVVDSEGRKLGKRFFSEAIRKRKEEGATPEELLGEAAYLAGILPEKIPVTLREILQLMTGGGICQ